MNTTSTDTMDQTFDRDAADEVARQASNLMARYAEELAQMARQAEANEQREVEAVVDSETLSLQLKVRAASKDYAQVMDECWDHVAQITESLSLAPLESEASYLNVAEGIIRLRAPANLALALIQEEEYFESVSLYTGPWH